MVEVLVDSTPTTLIKIVSGEERWTDRQIDIAVIKIAPRVLYL